MDRKAKPRIVVVDDEEWALQYVEVNIRRSLKEADVLIFQDGAQAWQELQRAETDLLITDVVRPGMDGWQMLRLLAERKVQYPILVASGFAKEADVRNCAGPNLQVTFLQKPWTQEAFAEILLRLIDAKVRP